ncbi:DUF2076 family protein [Cupriavidus basilensis]
MQALEAFLTQLTQARAGMKDPQADALIAEGRPPRQPDAAYLLVQRAMMLDHVHWRQRRRRSPRCRA